MKQRDRILQEYTEYELDWKNLTKRIEAVRHDLALTVGGEEQVILREKLARLTSDRSEVRRQLDELDQALNRLGPQNGRRRVFISYKRNAEPDHSVALYLDRFLNDRKIETFIDQKMNVGMAWVSEIQEQIVQSDFIVVLLSPSSMHSDMVLEEVKFADQQRRETGHPRILPIRLAYEGSLPYELDQYLQPLQYLLWNNDSDNNDIAWRIHNAIEGLKTTNQDVAAVVQDNQTGGSQNQQREQQSQSIEPVSRADPRAILDILEAPAGAVDLDSRFYIERPADQRLKRALSQSGTTVTIRAARQMGKTSLLVRGVDHARKHGSSIVFLDFQLIDASYLKSIETFLYYLAHDIAQHLRIDPETVETTWAIPVSAKDRLTQFIEDHVLPTVEKPIILAIDEADRLFESSFRQEFFGLIRAWFTRRTYAPIWKRLNIVMAISTQPFLLIDDPHQSPFNVGLRLEIQDLSRDQVSDLNDRHRTGLTDAALADMMALLGGHPYLVRQAFYTMVEEGMDWTDLAAIAVHEVGPFKAHLHKYLWQLRDQPDLIEAVRSVLLDQTCPDEIIEYRLTSAGLIQRHRGDEIKFRCGLYEAFFRRHLL